MAMVLLIQVLPLQSLGLGNQEGIFNTFGLDTNSVTLEWK